MVTGNLPRALDQSEQVWAIFGALFLSRKSANLAVSNYAGLGWGIFGNKGVI